MRRPSMWEDQEDRVCKVCQSGEVETEHHFLTSCEAYSSLRENVLNYFECDSTNEADLNEHSVPVEIMKSTDNETVIKLSNLPLYVLRRHPLYVLTANRLFN
jgi:hypothetical protein